MVFPKSVLIGKKAMIFNFFCFCHDAAFQVLDICFKLVMKNSIFDNMKIN